MKTPDEIKKGLEYCARLVCPLDECPFYKIEGSCALAKNLDALAYIQQLEAANAELLTKVEQLELDKTRLLEEGHELRIDMIGKIKQLERERDALLKDVHNYQSCICSYCKNRIFNQDEKKYACKEFGRFSDILTENPLMCGKFEWRGGKEE